MQRRSIKSDSIDSETITNLKDSKFYCGGGDAADLDNNQKNTDNSFKWNQYDLSRDFKFATLTNFYQK